MSHRSSDAYSRRPTDDDRRGQNHRDRRRDTLPWGAQEFHRDDRPRRNTDVPSKDRRDLPVSPAERLTPKLRVAVNSGRSVHANNASSTSRSPADSPDHLDRGTECARLVGLLKKHAEAVVDLARLRAERDPLDKVLKQRQADYEKSMAKHAELFPSVPEVQNLHRVKYAERVQVLDCQIQNAQHVLDTTAEAIVQLISIFSSAPSKGTETRAAAPTSSTQQQHASKELQAEVKELRTKIRRIETERSAERSTTRAEFTKNCEEMKREMKEQLKDQLERQKAQMQTLMQAQVQAQVQEMVKEMKEDMAKEINVLKRAREEASEDMEEQLRTLRGELETQQAQQETARRNDLLSEFSRHETELTKSIDQKLSSHTDSIVSTSVAEVTALIRKEKSSLEAGIADLLQRVEALTGQLAHAAQETVALRNSLATCAQRVEDEARKVEEHEAKLSSLDTDALEGVAEMMSIDFPDLQRKVASFQGRVDNIPQEVEAKQKALSDQVEAYVAGVGNTLGTMLDDLQKSVTDSEKRIKTLEEAPLTGRLDSSNIPPNQTADAESGLISSGTESIKSDVISTKAAVDRLAHDYAALSETVGQVSQGVSASNEDFTNQLAALRLSLMALDSQFNNLSTRTLAEHIIGQLEQVYPNARQLVADIDYLKTLLDRTGSRVDSLEDRLQDFKVKVDSFSETKLDDLKIAQMQEELLQHLGEPGSSVAGHKRKRMDSGLNGAEQFVSNGAE